VAHVDLAEVFEDDGDVHVDDDEEGDDQVGDEVDARQAAVSAVATRPVLTRRRVTVVVHQSRQHGVPACRRRHLEQQDDAAVERLKVEHIVENLPENGS